SDVSSWDSVTVLRKKPQSGTGVLKTNAAVNSAMRAGTLQAEKKQVQNTKTVYDAAKMGKLDNETEVFHVEKVQLTVSKAISKARTEKGLTQKDLATKINEKPTVVADYEAGKATNPNQQILGKMERALGVKLRGKDIGEPLTFGKKK
ncbi:multiprotein-bridging factor 1, partial [Lobulomyces angularis]